MIKTVSVDNNIKRSIGIYQMMPGGRTEKTGEDVYCRTDFLVDSVNDITAMNDFASVYLRYPAGSMAYCLSNNKKYILNPSQNEYVEVVS